MSTNHLYSNFELVLSVFEIGYRIFPSYPQFCATYYFHQRCCCQQHVNLQLFDKINHV